MTYWTKRDAKPQLRFEDSEEEETTTMINKRPGDPITFSWTFAVEDEASISGFDVIMEAKGANPTETIVQTVSPAGRATTGLTAPASGGGQYFFVCRSFLDDTSGKIYSTDSDEASINVVVLPVPEGFSVA